MNTPLAQFAMPRWREIPNVGLYLEQTIKYINECLAPLGVSITPSMLSNYVKQGYIRRPVKKQYDAEQIAYLLFLVLAKQVLSMENIGTLFRLQQETYPTEVAYTYFCTELEAMLAHLFDGAPTPPEPPADSSFAKKTLRSVIIAITQIIYLNHCFDTVATPPQP